MPQYPSIGAVSNRLGVPAHTLRYWEKEFTEFLNPRRVNGRRRYGEYEMSLLQRIREMLWDEKYSIAGARQKLQRLVLSRDADREPETLPTLPRAATEESDSIAQMLHS